LCKSSHRIQTRDWDLHSQEDSCELEAMRAIEETPLARRLDDRLASVLAIEVRYLFFSPRFTRLYCVRCRMWPGRAAPVSIDFRRGREEAGCGYKLIDAAAQQALEFGGKKMCVRV